jgi:hypothetical protein
MQAIFRDPLFRRIVAATVGLGALGSFIAGLSLSISPWALLLAAIGALISLALGFLLAVSTLAHRQLGAAQFWKVALQNYLVLNAINAALVFFMTADPTRQFAYGLIGLAILSPLAVGASWFTQAATPKPA